MYFARIYTTIEHFRNVEKREICDKIAGIFYLSRDEYVAQCPLLCKEDCWHAMATEWSDSKFQKKIMRQIEPITTAINLSLTKEDQTLLQQYAKNCLRN
uniref:Uncharacterized protein n=1 Tax=Arundo donax TaxID=35708 RepID=A0A0A9GWB4_ARUDO